ncbi:glycosyltransferase family 2 protein [Bordetella flabilis]|uniref:Glycosyl transferase family 2 n=1 Tax=Bordetella flabilis TaxID=463014 RepID=A0A193GAH6_9BORD|nr:glycosyltransferase family A protein [Bordetella flabilis]ANN76633.1 glycosyl transferase family 2 [Bordetella flabilis]
MNAETQPRISVVVPTYRRPDLLERCLGALLRQTLPVRDYEIVVCDDGPSQAAHDVVRRLAPVAGGPTVRYVPVTDTQGPAGARNAGWRQARADIIAFTDDDTVPDPAWLAAGLAALAPEVDALSGRIVMPLPANPTDYELDASRLQDAEFATANVFVRRHALEAVGGFDPRFTLAWREDSDLHFSLMEHGFRIVRAPQAIVVHPVRPAPFGAGIGMQRKIVFDTLLYKKHPRLYRERIRPHPPWFYLSVTALLIVALAAFAAGQGTLGAIAGAGWLALTAWFCARRLRGTRRTLDHIVEMAMTSATIPPASIFWRVVGSLRFRAGFP